MFWLRDFIGNFSIKRSETLQSLNRFVAKSVSSVSSVSIWNAVWHGVSDRVVSVLVLNIIGTSFVEKYVGTVVLRFQGANFIRLDFFAWMGWGWTSVLFFSARGPIGRAVLGYVCFCNLPQVHSTRDVYNGAFSVDFGCVEWSIC